MKAEGCMKMDLHTHLAGNVPSRAVTSSRRMTFSLAATRPSFSIFFCSTSLFLLTVQYQGQKVSEWIHNVRNNTLNILFRCRGALWGCSCRICYRQSVVSGTWFSNSSFVYVFLSLHPSLCSLLPVFLLLIASLCSLKSELWSVSSSARREALDIFDIVSDLYSVPISKDLGLVVYDDTQPSLLTLFISFCPLPSVSPLLQWKVLCEAE